ncbi:MAG: ABC transporter substrate-binding protein [Candidatus Eisenbacteria bacterium]
MDRSSGTWPVTVSSLVALVALILSVGCGTAPPAGPGTNGPGASAPLQWIIEPSPDAAGVTNVFLPEPVSPLHAPVPTNDSERIVFGELYVGLTRIDGAGQLVPMLADQIYSTKEKVWKIHLRHGLRFSDGTSLEAVDVVRSWALAKKRHPSLAVWNGSSALVVRVQGPRDIVVQAPTADLDVPRLLAEAPFAVVSYRSDDTLPIGAGPMAAPLGRSQPGSQRFEPNPNYAAEAPHDGDDWLSAPVEERVEKLLSSTGKSLEELKPVVPGPDAEGRRPVVFRFAGGADPRDAATVSPPIDATFVRDLESIRFLTKAGLVNHELPEDRGYVLLVAGPVPEGLPLAELAELTSSEAATPWTEFEVAEERTASPTIEEFVILERQESAEAAGGEAKPDFGRAPQSGRLLGFGPIETGGLPEAERIARRLAALWTADTVVRTDDAPHERLRPGQAVVLPIARGVSAPNLSALSQHWLDMEGEMQIGIVSLLQSRPSLLTSPQLRGVRLTGTGVPRFDASSVAEGAAIAPGVGSTAP